MTEDKWLAAANPLHLLMHVRRTSHRLHSKAGKRKFRLFACGCVRRIWTALSPPQRSAVEASERFADGEVDDEYLSEALHAIPSRSLPRSVRDVAFTVIEPQVWEAAKVWQLTTRPNMDALRGNKPVEEKRLLAALVRDLFGNPFRPVTPDPSWLTSTAVGLASAIYVEHAFDRMPILADALEDAGCDNPDLLAHLRGDGPHIRGCWAVDLVLGKR